MATPTVSRRPAKSRLASTVALTAAMAAIAAALLAVVAGTVHPSAPFTLGLAAVVAIMTAAESATIDRQFAGQRHTLSLSEIGLVIGLAFAAPVTLIIGRLIAVVIVHGAIKRLPAPKLGFNTALFALETTAAATVYHSLIGHSAVYEPAGWLAMTAALLTATIIGLGAVRAILTIHGITNQRFTTLFSLAITLTATTIGIIGVVALTLTTDAAVLITALAAMAFAAMRTINSLTSRR